MNKLSSLIKSQCEAWSCWPELNEEEKLEVEEGYRSVAIEGALGVIDALKRRVPDFKKKENVFMRGEQAAEWVEKNLESILK